MWKQNNRLLKPCDFRSLLVRLKGFEPPTYWFVASHSIQLSYSRISLCWRFFTRSLTA